VICRPAAREPRFQVTLPVCCTGCGEAPRKAVGSVRVSVSRTPRSLPWPLAEGGCAFLIVNETVTAVGPLWIMRESESTGGAEMAGDRAPAPAPVVCIGTEVQRKARMSSRGRKNFNMFSPQQIKVHSIGISTASRV
jgi:hypothetical protein